MPQAFLHLLARSWARLMANFSMSTTGFIAVSCGLPVLIYVALILVPASFERNNSDGFLKNVWNRTKRSRTETVVSVTVVLVFWIVACSISLAQTLYDEHLTLVSNVSRLTKQSTENEKARDEWKAKFEASEREPRARSRKITENIPTTDHVNPGPSEERKCWLSNLAGFPNSKIEGAVTAAAAIIHCNYKIDAPYIVQVEFDRDFISGATTIADGSTMQEGEGKTGLVRWNRILGPPLLSGQVLIVTVYGRTDQYPRAKTVKIETLK